MNFFVIAFTSYSTIKLLIYITIIYVLMTMICTDTIIVITFKELIK